MPEEAAKSLTSREALRLLRDTLGADFERDNGPEARITLTVWRLGQVARQTTGAVGGPVRLLARVLTIVWIRLAMRAELPASVRPGPGLKLGHGGRGVILHPQVVIGSNVTIFHDVTMGVSRAIGEVPTIKDDVLIGVGARVLGSVTVGRGATVGPNSVVVVDAEPGFVYLGVPASKRGRVRA